VDEGTAAARRLYEAGADVVYHAAGSAGGELPRVATELSAELGRQLWAIGVDSDQWLAVSADEQAHVLTSMVKRFDRELASGVDRFFSGTLTAGVIPLGMDDGMVSLARSGEHLDAATLARIDDLTDGLKKGTIKVSDVPTDSPSALPDADGELGVTIADGECKVDAPPSIALGTSLRVDLANDSSGVATFVFSIGAEPAPAEDIKLGYAFALVAQSGGHDAGVIDPPESGSWTLSCVDADLQPIGSPTHLDVEDG